jgi:predicted permease
MHDLRYAARVLRKNPGFTIGSVLTLALGIGLNTSIFSIFDAMALRPVRLPGTTPALTMYQDMRGAVDRTMMGGPSLFSYPEYLDYRDHNHVFSGLTAYTPEFRALVDAEVNPVRGQLTACDYFAVLGITPVLGRGFLPSECAAMGAGPVMVLSDAFWRSHFAGDRNVIGRVVKLNRVPLTVIGVAPPGFTGTEIEEASYWVPLSMQGSLAGRLDKNPVAQNADVAWLTPIGRLRAGMTTAQARADLGLIASRRDAEYKNRVTTLSLSEPNYFGRRDKRLAIIASGSVFLVAFGLVLLIVCANLANFFLARATGRQREIAVRLAIGASRGQIVRQLVIESLLIAIVGGVLGTAVSLVAARSLVDFVQGLPDMRPLSIAIHPDARVFGYALLLVLISACAFGLAPALHATRPDLTAALKEGAEGTAARSRLRNTLVGLQVAVSMVLLITAGLLLRGLSHAERANPGFEVEHTMTMSVDFRAEGYTKQRAIAFGQQLERWVHSIAGVTAVARASTAPLGGRHYFGTFTPSGAEGTHQIQYNRVTHGFFSAVGIPIVRGRDFSPAETNGDLAIVSEAAARLLWPGQDPLGKTLRGGQETYTVVGVARDAEVSELGQAHEPYLYFSPSGEDALEMGTIIVHGSAPDPAVAAALRAGALSQDRDLHLKIAPLRENMRSYVEASQVLASLSALLASAALLLASIGIYGTVAFSVARRTREIGIRMALGAQARNVVAVVARDTMKTVFIGSAIGMTLSALVTRVLTRVLFGVSPLDLVAFLGVPAVLIGIAALASYIPSRRAVRVDPLIALRSE